MGELNEMEIAEKSDRQAQVLADKYALNMYDEVFNPTKFYLFDLHPEPEPKKKKFFLKKDYDEWFPEDNDLSNISDELLEELELI